MEDKNEILSKLYSLRAGIGELYNNSITYENTRNIRIDYVSQETKDCENKIVEFEKIICDKEQAINDIEEKSNVKKLQKLVEDYENKPKTNQKTTSTAGKIGEFLGVLLFCEFCAGIIGGLLYLIFGTWNILYVLLGIGFIFSLFSFYPESEDEEKQLKEKLEKEKAEVEKKTLVLRRDLEWYKTAKKNSSQKLIELKTADEETVSNAKNQSNYLEKNMHILKNSLNLTFDSMIDERDWANLDLIIYYFETGRALSIREALLLSDQQRQINQIVQAVNHATESISSSFYTSLNILGDRVEDSIEKLNKNLTKLAKEEMSKLSSINRSAQDISVNISTLKNTINTSSQKMVSMIESQRPYWENKI